MFLQEMPESGASPEVPVNENFEALDWAAVYAKNALTTSGLTWGYLGGRFGGTAISTGTVALTNTATNYVVVLRSSGAVSVSTSATNWNNPGAYARLYKLTVAGGLVTATEDHRAGPYGVFGKSPFSWNGQTDSYTLVLADEDNGVEINKATAVNLTIPPNSSVAFAVGASILVYQAGAGKITVVPGSGVTIRCSNQVGSPSPALAINAQYGLATIVKRDTNEWILSGDLVTV